MKSTKLIGLMVLCLTAATASSQSLSERAFAEAKSYLLSKLIQRGDSWIYFQDHNGFYDTWREFKGVRFQFVNSELSSADKLNGLEYRGKLIVVCEAQRGCAWNKKVPHTAVWDQWTDGGAVIALTVESKKGAWHFDGLDDGVKKADATQLSQIREP